MTASSPLGNEFAFEAMGQGWGRIGDQIALMAADA